MRSKKMKARKEEIEEEVFSVDDEKESQDEEVKDSEEQSGIEQRKGQKKKKAREKEAEKEEKVEDHEVEDEVQEFIQITDEESEEKSESEEEKKNGFMSVLDLAGSKMKSVKENEEEDKQLMEEESKEERENEEKDKQLTEEESEEERKNEEEDKQLTEEESEEERETEEKRKKGLKRKIAIKWNEEASEGDKCNNFKKRIKSTMEEESEEEIETKEKRKNGLKRKIAIKWNEEASEGDKSPKKINIEKQTKKKISNKKNSPHLPLDGDDDDDDDCDDDMELKYDSDGSLIDDDEKSGVITQPSKCQLSPEEKQKLENLFIRLEHKVLPQHRIEKTAGTRALTKEEKAEFEKYTELRTGKYLPHENKQLRRNWKHFCEENEWNVNNPRPFLQMRYKNKVAFIDFKQRMKFIQFLANGLNNRSLYSVFNRFKVLYDPHKVSRYSSSEDDIIIEYVRRYKLSDRERDRKFAELASILKRTRASVWRRYRVLKRKRNILNDSKDDCCN